MLLGESFAIVAPTGVGKTTLLLVYGTYMASKGKRVYVLVPTENLLLQTRQKLASMIERLGKDVRAVSYSSRDCKSARERALEHVVNGSFDILLTTTSFLSRRFGLLEGMKFDVIIIDDADSLLKKSKNIDRVLLLLGFSSSDIEAAYKLLKAKGELALLRAVGAEDRLEKKLLEVEELQLRVNEALATKKIGQVIIASATGRQVGLKPKLFRELLGFEIGGIYDYMRNLIEAYHIGSEGELLEKVVDVVKMLGHGGLVFVSRDKGTSYARKIVDILKESGVKAELAIAGRRVLDRLSKGEAEVLVGVASYYGVLVRGIDLPEVIKYVVFLGVPKNRVLLEKSLRSPARAIQVLAHVCSGEEEKRRFNDLRKRVERLSYNELLALRIALEGGNLESLTGFLADTAVQLKEAREWVINKVGSILPREAGAKLVVGLSYIERGSDGNLYMVSPEHITYIQASGRASRFLENRMTLGLSLVLECDETAIELLKRRLSRYVFAFNPVPLSSLDLIEVRKKLERSRLSGGEARSFKPAKSVMIIVESPNKARTIANFFGRPSRRRLLGINIYETAIVDPKTLDTYIALVAASKGHIFDLTQEDIGFHGVIVGNNEEYIPVYAPIKKCVSCNTTFTTFSKSCPRCGESSRVRSSLEVVQVLRKLSLEVEEVLIATDPDVEGEKIAWELALTLRPFAGSIKRVELREITRESILEAIRGAKHVSERRVAAQITRRVADRWIGFSLSQRLWEEFNKNWLGAGRVQTPVLGWIIKRYEEWKSSKGYWLLIRTLNGPSLKLFVESREEAKSLLDKIEAEMKVPISSVSFRIERTNPQPPLTTDEMLYEAGRLFGYTAPYTMKLAQDLFEAGLITYHRTDSTRVSERGIAIAGEYLRNKLGKPELFSPKEWSDKGAHEAIRPTMPIDAEELRRLVLDGTVKVYVKMSEGHYNLYDLIFRRFMASQCRPSLVERAVAHVLLGNRSIVIEPIVGIVQEGHVHFLKDRVFRDLKEELKAGYMKVESVLIYRGSLTPLFTQGELVLLMKKRGLGRPSTYSSIIQNILKHGYAIVSKNRRFLVPTKLGMEVYHYLQENFPQLVSEATTVMLESLMDDIEEGKVDYREGLARLLREIEPLGLAKRASTFESRDARISKEALV